METLCCYIVINLNIFKNVKDLFTFIIDICVINSEISSKKSEKVLSFLLTII